MDNSSDPLNTIHQSINLVMPSFYKHEHGKRRSEHEGRTSAALSEANTDNSSPTAPDLEKAISAHLDNDVVRDFAWRNFNVTVKDRTTKQPLSIISNANGIVRAGEMLAIMGPSGSGKTTLLNAIAYRAATAGASTTGDILVNGRHIGLAKLRQFSAYVEQEDALIGSLTVAETMSFAARLSLSRCVLSRQEHGCTLY